MHGQGTLTLKSGKTFTGQWIAGSIAAYAQEIQSLETEWHNWLIEDEKRQKKEQELLNAQKKRLREDKLIYQKENDPLSLATNEEGIAYLMENPLYVATEWLEVVRSLGLLKYGKCLKPKFGIRSL